MITRIINYWLLIVCCMALPSFASAATYKTVLLLHSYHAGFKWTDDITLAVQQEFFDKHIDLRIEHLDTKRYFSPSYLKKQKDFLQTKYFFTAFDVLLVADNHALNFTLKYRDELFPGIPIVFCGINSFTPELIKGHDHITGINEAIDARKTVDLMLSLKPKTEKILVINDGSVSGKIIEQAIKDQTHGHYPLVEWQYVSNPTTEELLTRLKSLSSNDLVLLGNFFRDRNSRQYEYFESAELISNNSSVPVFSLYDFYLGHGILGGFLTNGWFQGQSAAKAVLEILQGKTADEIPIVMESPNRYFVDYAVLQKYGFSDSVLPPETIYINRKPDFYNDHKVVIWITAVFMIFLIVLSLLLSINIIKKKKAEKGLQRLTSELSDRVEERTRELSLASLEMQRREEQMQHLLSNLSGMVYRCKNDPYWTMLYVSDGCNGLTKYAPEELLDNTLIAYSELIDPRDTEHVSSIVATAIETKKHFTIEYRIKCKDDTVKWVWEQGLAIYDESGNCLYLDGIITDITERKQIEEEQKRLTTAVEQTDDLIIITDIDGNIQYANPAFERVTGYQLHEVKGCNPRILKSGQHDSSHYNELWGEITAGRAWRGRFVNKKKDGSHYIAEVTISPIRNQQGDLINYIGVQRDITHTIELEKHLRQAQKLEAMGTLAGGIAHEINTPTQFVASNLDFINDSLPDLTQFITELAQLSDKDKAEELFEKHDVEYLLEELPLAVTQSSEGVSQISRIVRSMKQFAHPGEDSKADTDINDAIKNTTTVCRNEWKYCAEMTFDLDEQLPMVPCHRSEINQVFLNIVVNAAHAITAHHQESGTEGVITIKTRKNGDFVEISITDNGGGVPEELKERIFDPFFTTKEPGKGTGQGLAIAHSIVTDKHGGSLHVDSRAGEGSTFVIRLPLS